MEAERVEVMKKRLAEETQNKRKIEEEVNQTRQKIDKNNTNLPINVTENGTKTVTVNAGGSITTKKIDFDTANSVNIP